MTDDNNLCPNHTNILTKSAENTVKIKTIQDEIHKLREKTDLIYAKHNLLEGNFDSSYPNITNNIKSIFDIIKKIEETSRLYNGQVREATAKIKAIELGISEFASQANIKHIERELDKKASIMDNINIKDDLDKIITNVATKESVNNVNGWVRGGFILVAVSFILWVLTVLSYIYGFNIVTDKNIKNSVYSSKVK